jgi:hypothetical protein
MPATHSASVSSLPPIGVDQAVLSALLFEPASGPWAIDELARETRRSPVEVDDSLWRLSRTGVVHRLGDSFVFVSRAAAHAAALLDPEAERVSWTRRSPKPPARGALTL